MKLTEEQIRRWPALACLVSGHGMHVLAQKSYEEKYGEPPDGGGLEGAGSRRAGGELAALLGDVDWIRQTVHRGTHIGSLDGCRKNTCDAALKMLGKR